MQYSIKKITGLNLNFSKLADIIAIQSNLAIGKRMLKTGLKVADQGLLISGHEPADLQKF